MTVGAIEIAQDKPFVLVAGPCALESTDHALMMAEKLAEICAKVGVPYIFKASFDKANRSSIGNYRGPGLEGGLAMLAAVKERLGLPVLTDVHEAGQCAPAAEVADVIQIPALLCRQTDLLLGAGQSGKPVNVKKGQFVAPWDMANVAAKIASTGNEDIILCERGTSFGYNTLVTDFRGLPTMASAGYPVMFDATHSVQQPGGKGTSSGGQREFAPLLARAAVSVGVASVFIETHQDPENAPCDGPNMIPLHEMSALLGDLKAFDDLAKARPLSI
ncbi:MAG: 3-deoxy-8-phosphooctulonate synthase [Neomegalonema sp.]|nr:3-deoxy-8-phosphooctulonate synthase [Neomegalonema sp.]